MVELKDITASQVAGLAIIRCGDEPVAVAFARADEQESGDARAPQYLTWMKGKKGKVWEGSDAQARLASFLDGTVCTLSMDATALGIKAEAASVLIPAANHQGSVEALEASQGRERDNLLSREVALTSATTGGAVPIGDLQTIVEGGSIQGLGAMRGFEAGQRILNVAKADAMGIVDAIRHLKRGAAGGKRAAGRRGTARAYKRDEERSR